MLTDRMQRAEVLSIIDGTVRVLTSRGHSRARIAAHMVMAAIAIAYEEGVHGWAFLGLVRDALDKFEATRIVPRDRAVPS